ncbi:MAG: hypothetical protein PHD95_01105 [Candidatus ainarchaeum sp.]|nr:hypothetical protein [Candidatus ainarchaeum sp.]
MKCLLQTFQDNEVSPCIDGPLQASVFWLTGLKYLEEKKAVLAEFSCSGLKRTASMAFFPSLLVSKKALSKEALKREISLLGNQKFELIEMDFSFKVVSSNFSVLQKLANNIFSSAGALAIMPSPERQFLIEKDWGFFDAFAFEETSKGEIPVKTNCLDLPNVKTGFFSEPLPKTIAELSKIDSAEACSVLSLVSLSKILFLPLEKIPGTGFLRQEIFLENHLFKNNFAPREMSKKTTNETHKTQFASFLRGTPEFDTAPLIPMLLTNACYNLGFETIDCDCCSPEKITAKNILSSSLVEVEFLKEAFYFDSASASFADFFHESNPLKENRLRRKREFFLGQFPVGPFCRNQKSIVPLADAIALEQGKDAKILGFSERHWFCMEKESFLSKLILETREKIFGLDLFIEKAHEKCFSGNNVITGFAALENDFAVQLALECKKNLEFFLNNLPAHISDSESRFFNTAIAGAVDAIQASAAKAFGKTRLQEAEAESAMQTPLSEYLLSISKKAG